MIPPNTHEIPKHAGCVPGKAYLRPFHVTPSHGNLDDLETLTRRKKQEFGIESEPVRCLLAEDRYHGFTFEELESALRIVNVQAQQKPHHHIEHDAADFAHG